MTHAKSKGRQVVALSIDISASHEEMTRQVTEVIGSATDGLIAALHSGGVTNAYGVVLDALAALYLGGAVTDGRLAQAAGFARDLIRLADSLVWPLNTALTGAVDWTEADAIQLYANPPAHAPGAVRGYFAVHRRPRGSEWRLTHLPTGMALVGAAAAAPLRRFAEQIEGLCDWGWSHPNSPEALAAKKAIAAHMMEFRQRHRDLTDFQAVGRA